MDKGGGLVLGSFIKKKLENNGQTIAWLADKLLINEKTLAGKLNRDSISGEDILIMTALLGIDIKELQKEVYNKKFNYGGVFMNGEKVVKIIEQFIKEGVNLTKKQKAYLDEFYQVGILDIKYIYNKDEKEVFLWCATEAFEELSSCEFYLNEDESSLFVKIEDEVIAGYKDYGRSINFIEMLINVQNDKDIDEDGNYIEEE